MDDLSTVVPALAISREKIFCSHYHVWAQTTPGGDQCVGGWPEATYLGDWFQKVFRSYLWSFTHSLRHQGISPDTLNETEMWFYKTSIGSKVHSVNVVMILVVKQ